MVEIGRLGDCMVSLLEIHENNELHSLHGLVGGFAFVILGECMI